jgi:hypothetical protein
MTRCGFIKEFVDLNQRHHDHSINLFSQAAGEESTLKAAATMTESDSLALLRPVERDLRLDLFRGIGLWMIFLDHIPHDVVSWLTLRNYGFSDAAEFFVFISGYLVGWIYAPIIRGGLFLAAVKRLWKRVAQMYVAHIMLFLIFTAQIARTARRFDNPLYENELNVFNFL